MPEWRFWILVSSLVTRKGKLHPRSSSGSWFFLNRLMKTICSPKRSSAAAIASLVLLSLFVCCCSVMEAAAIIGDPGIVGVFFPERESDDSGGAIGIGGGGVLARSAAGGLKVLQLWHQFSFWLQFEHCSGFAEGGDETGLGGGEGAWFLF